MKRAGGVFVALSILSIIFAQPAIEWQRCIGGSNDDYAYAVEQTADGGYIVAGCTKSGDIPGVHGEWDILVVKLNSSGDIQWQRCLGGRDSEFVYSV
ncbi:MAG TPA: hypothetical protein ENG11_05435, partial [candidate division Zixibacteria bacterium]|nr:hypothetical protein [candidate division Zixibacteria bacterium]